MTRMGRHVIGPAEAGRAGHHTTVSTSTSTSPSLRDVGTTSSPTAGQGWGRHIIGPEAGRPSPNNRKCQHHQLPEVGWVVSTHCLDPALSRPVQHRVNLPLLTQSIPHGPADRAGTGQAPHSTLYMTPLPSQTGQTRPKPRNEAT